MIPGSSRTASELQNTEATPVHERTSRRILGLPVEYGPLPGRTPRMTGRDNSAPVPPATPTPVEFVIHQPRVPKSFHGDAFEDVEDWLDQFERVASFNGWNEQRKRQNVYFALDDPARTWFENNEATMSSWEEFRRRLLATYVSIDRKEKAENALQARNQRPNESVAMYVEDMVRLFRRADPSMPDDKKLRHLMRGVKQEIFAGLIRNPPGTVPEFVAEATSIERALQQRARQHSHPEAAAPGTNILTALEGNVDGLCELIRRIVREELQAMRHGPVSTSTVSVAELVRDEIRRAVVAPERADECSRPEPQRPSYSEALRQPHCCPPPTVAAVERQPFVSSMPRTAAPYSGEPNPRKSDLWRTPDRRPLCFHCGEPGHVYRACPYRHAGLRGFARNAPRPRNGERPPEIESYLAERHMFPPRRLGSRSPSPNQHRSVSPRFAPNSTNRLSRSTESRGN